MLLSKSIYSIGMDLNLQSLDLQSSVLTTELYPPLGMVPCGWWGGDGARLCGTGDLYGNTTTGGRLWAVCGMGGGAAGNGTEC